MNECLQHDAYLRANPEDRTAALALVDHAQEEYGLSRLDALKAVAQTRRAARHERDHATAARYLAPMSDFKNYLHRCIAEAVFRPHLRGFTVLVAPGRHVPVVTSPEPTTPVNQWLAPLILVSAKWVLLRMAEWMDPRCTGLSIRLAKEGHMLPAKRTTRRRANSDRATDTNRRRAK